MKSNKTGSDPDEGEIKMGSDPNKMVYLDAWTEGCKRRDKMSETKPMLEIQNLHVEVEGKEILNGVDLTVNKGEIHALMGPNGSGKSTLSFTLMGHPRYVVTEGKVLFEGEDLLSMEPDERARKGVFLAFQYPNAIPGVTVVNFLRQALKAVRGQDISVKEFRKTLKEKMKMLEINNSFAGRYLNDGFSGGEKKRHEILQLAILSPKLAILDETDSGLDIDALKTVCGGINHLAGPEIGVLIITHYQRMLNYITPHIVHVMANGKVIKSGGPELAKSLEQTGYEGIIQEQQTAAAVG